MVAKSRQRAQPEERMRHSGCDQKHSGSRERARSEEEKEWKRPCVLSASDATTTHARAHSVPRCPHTPSQSPNPEWDACGRCISLKASARPSMTALRQFQADFQAGPAAILGTRSCSLRRRLPRRRWVRRTLFRASTIGTSSVACAVVCAPAAAQSL